jgi:hypothetical protein
MQAGRFIADDGPKPTIEVVVAQGDMHRAVPLLFVKLHGMPTAGFPPLKMNIIQLAPSVADPPNSTIALDTNAVVPANLIH